MKLRKLEWLLLAAVVLGGVLAWQSGHKRTRLQTEYQRLARLTGDLEITDPTQVYIRGVMTGEPLHFAWRMYLPPNYTQILTDNHGGSSPSSRSWSRAASEFITRIRFREDDQGMLEIHSRFSGGGSRMTLGNVHLAKALHGRWDKVQVEQLGGTGQVSLKPDQTAVLLRLTLPDEIYREVREQMPPESQEKFVPQMFEMQLGPNPQKP